MHSSLENVNWLWVVMSMHYIINSTTYWFDGQYLIQFRTTLCSLYLIFRNTHLTNLISLTVGHVTTRLTKLRQRNVKTNQNYQTKLCSIASIFVRWKVSYYHIDTITLKFITKMYFSRKSRTFIWEKKTNTKSNQHSMARTRNHPFVIFRH